MKLRKVVTINKPHKRTNQVSLNIKAKELKKLGITPKQMIEMFTIKPRVKPRDIFKNDKQK